MDHICQRSESISIFYIVFAINKKNTLVILSPPSKYAPPSPFKSGNLRFSTLILNFHFELKTTPL